MSFYHQELKKFNQRHVDYIIVGGMAFNLLGGFRSTADLDIIINLISENLTKITEILFGCGYKVLQPVNPIDILDKSKRKKLADEKNMKALTFYKQNSLHQNKEASYNNLEAVRSRRLLLNKKEIERINGRLASSSLTLVPTKLYFNKRGFVKVEVALAQGKNAYDKREDIKKREAKREMDRGIKGHR